MLHTSFRSFNQSSVTYMFTRYYGENYQDYKNFHKKPITVFKIPHFNLLPQNLSCLLKFNKSTFSDIYINFRLTPYYSYLQLQQKYIKIIIITKFF